MYRIFSNSNFVIKVTRKMSPIIILSLFLCKNFMLIDSAAWTLVWNDEFNSGIPLTNNWNFETGCTGNGNGELQCNTFNRTQNARLNNGVLTIETRRETWTEDGKTLQFTSARMTTKTNWTYGKFRVKARLPDGKHVGPAIWMFPAEQFYGTWPKSGEIDLMEYRGQVHNQIMGTIHYGPAWNQKASPGSGMRNYTYDFSKEWHVFGLEWNTTAITWSLDEKPFFTGNLDRILWDNVYMEKGQPFDRSFFLILSLGVGGNLYPESEFGTFVTEDSSTWVKPTLEVDYVRVYQWI